MGISERDFIGSIFGEALCVCDGRLNLLEDVDGISKCCLKAKGQVVIVYNMRSLMMKE